MRDFRDWVGEFDWRCLLRLCERVGSDGNRRPLIKCRISRYMPRKPVAWLMKRGLWIRNLHGANRQKSLLGECFFLHFT